MNALEKLREVTDTIAKPKNGLALVDAWSLASRLLSRFPVDRVAAEHAVKQRDHAALDAIVSALEHPPVKARPDAPPVTDADMKAAMRAFHKRLKLTRLDQESKLGGRYTSAGKKSDVDAILPPDDFPGHVWDALVEAGRLKPVGHGFYAET